MQPAGHLPPQPWLKDPYIIDIMTALMKGGKAARFVGGCVRDALAERPISDVDIATPESPENAILLLTKAGIKVKPIGIEHGSVMAIHGEHGFNITTLRTDVETHGRHATVAYIDNWEADAHRRDFTINALYADLDGTFYDPCGGRQDLDQGIVRFIGDAPARIKEDYLRILRFFRFQAHYGSHPVSESDLEACSVYADQLSFLSKERIWQELYKLLEAPRPFATVKLMCSYGILAAILPGHPNIHRLEEVILREENYQIPSRSIRRLACLYVDDLESANNLHRNLALSLDEIKCVTQLVQLSIESPNLEELYENHKILYEKGAAFYLDYAILNSANLEKSLEIYKSWSNPKLPISGQDLMDLGIPTGPEMGQIIQEVTHWWLQNRCKPGKTEALGWVRARNKL